ncbi:MAG: beta-phosphoglucomutase [Ruminiclostridium sp.]|nr:beta-phosphoglucomutase [Ruminiclostridium sp.]
MKYRAILFDLDGVICHTDQYHYQAWKTIADELGINFDEEINNRLRGIGRMKSLEIILEKNDKNYTDDEKNRIVYQKNEIYKKLLLQMSAADLSKEVKETLIKLKQMGLRLAIGSSSKNAGIILRQIGLEYFFDAVSDGNLIQKSKPDPEVFLKASEMVGVKPKDCLVVEDAKAGVEAAAAAGMDCAAIGDATKSNLAAYNLYSFSDLLTVT